MTETGSIKGIFAEAGAKFKEQKVLSKLNPLARMGSFFSSLKEQENGQQIVDAGWRVIVYTAGEVISGGRDEPLELSSEVLTRLAPDVTRAEVEAALKSGMYMGVKVRNATEATLTIGAYKNGKVLAENSKVIAGAYGAEIKEGFGGAKALAKITVETARDIFNAAKTFGSNLKEPKPQMVMAPMTA